MVTRQDTASLSTPLRTIAVAAVTWGMPILSVDAMRQAFFRDAHASYHDIVYWSKPADWRLQLATPNASAHYAYTNFNTAAGPIVLETPPVTGAGLFGTILDAWQVPQADIGPTGSDAGRGGKYLLLPPHYADQVPAGFIARRMRTFNGYAALRAIPEGSRPEQVARAIELIQELRMYPLACAAGPPTQRFIDMAGKLFDGIVKFDAGLYVSLARMVDEELPLQQDAAMLRNIEVLGIRKGMPFSPRNLDPLFRDAARDAHERFTRRAASEGRRFWPDRAWRSGSTVGAKTHFWFEENGILDIDARGLFYFLSCAPPATVGAAAAYLTTYRDEADSPLHGEQTYHLRVPPQVPARQFWAVTLYDASTAAFVRDAPRVEINSYERQIAHNADGSVDIYFGPRPVPGKETNWITTVPGTLWFAMFRFYGPGRALADRTWQLPDIEEMRVTG